MMLLPAYVINLSPSADDNFGAAPPKTKTPALTPPDTGLPSLPAPPPAKAPPVQAPSTPAPTMFDKNAANSNAGKNKLDANAQMGASSGTLTQGGKTLNYNNAADGNKAPTVVAKGINPLYLLIGGGILIYALTRK